MPLPSTLKFIFAIALAASIPPVSPVTVHEWGTFTSVAGSNGESVPWVPLSEVSSDLPCFVHRLGSGLFKYNALSLIRMETPVDYFYTQSPARIAVHVDFPAGRITEWYPKAATLDSNKSIDWTDLNIQPGVQELPATKGRSRYYAARATDSTPLQSGDESEKFLFYRGVGEFKVPLEPVSEGNGVRLHNNGAEPIAIAILFENQNGRIGYRIARDIKNDTLLYAPDLNAKPDNLRGELISALEQAGLYPKEAAAMLETWRDSWFEVGMRVIYLMPRAEVDKVLPFRVSPAPRELQRVFVGRAEILSPWTNHTIRLAMETGDTKTLDQFSRFLSPFLAQIRAKSGLTESPVATSYIEEHRKAKPGDSAPCVQ